MTMESAVRIGMRPLANEAGAAVQSRLSATVGENHAFLGNMIDVRRRMAERRAASRIGAEVVPARVVRHQHVDVGPLLLRCRRRQRRGRGEDGDCR